MRYLHVLLVRIVSVPAEDSFQPKAIPNDKTIEYWPICAKYIEANTKHHAPIEITLKIIDTLICVCVELAHTWYKNSHLDRRLDGHALISHKIILCMFSQSTHSLFPRMDQQIKIQHEAKP